jgi:hypothetical protein
MMMMDLLADHGLRAASLMDNLRGAPDETMVERLQIARLLAALKRSADCTRLVSPPSPIQSYW